MGPAVHPSMTLFQHRFLRESNLIESFEPPVDELQRGWNSGRGHAGALRLALEIAEQKRTLDAETLFRMQELIVREQLPYGIWIAEEHIGRPRPLGLRVGGILAAPPATIPARLAALLERLERELHRLQAAGDRSSGLDLVAATHFEFERIHPFMDGNGRTGRLLALHALRYLGLGPVLFTAASKLKTYFPAFQRDDPQGMIEYFRVHQLSAESW